MTQTTPTFDRPVTARRPGGHKKRRVDQATADPGNQNETGQGGAAQVQTAPPVSAPAVSRETASVPRAGLDVADLEAELQRRGLADPALTAAQMTDGELLAELQRRRGGVAIQPVMSGGSMAVPPESVNNTRIEGDLSRPLPHFTADPHAEARRLLELDSREPVYVPGAPADSPSAKLPRVVAVRQPELPTPVTDEHGALVRSRPEPADATNPFPVRISPEGSEDVWYEIALPNGGTARVRASDVVIDSMPSPAQSPGEAPPPNYRCSSPAPGCPDFYLDIEQVPPGAYPRCPTCGDKRLLPLF